MEKIPTACEFITSTPGHLTGDVDDETLMIEFAKLHVEEALKAASKKSKAKEGQITDYKLTNSILKSYPLDNIK
jgi:hypothetical protein